jgi:YHS domain-containing protein
MAELDTLLNRIDAEFHAVENKIKQAQLENMQDYRDRQARLVTFDKVLDELRTIWKPRLEALQQRFGDKVQITPRLTPSSREATFEFQSALARIRLKFCAYADRDVKQVHLTSDLDIVPVLTQFDAHSELKFPVDSPNKGQIAKWIEDRIVAFVHTYLSIHENNFYLKDHLVSDPITGVEFPKYAAGATQEWKGATYYFVDNVSKAEFNKKNNIAG